MCQILGTDAGWCCFSWRQCQCSALCQVGSSGSMCGRGALGLAGCLTMPTWVLPATLATMRSGMPPPDVCMCPVLVAFASLVILSKHVTPQTHMSHSEWQVGVDWCCSCVTQQVTTGGTGRGATLARQQYKHQSGLAVGGGAGRPPPTYLQD